MAVVGTNNFIDRELTQQEFSDRGFPAFYVLKNEAKQIIKFIAFDAAGDRSDVYFDPTVILYATQDDLNAEIVNRAIADQNLQNQVNTINAQKSAVVDKMLHYWDATLGKWLSSSIAFVSGKFGFNNTSPSETVDVTGRVKANSLVLANEIGTAVPNELGRKNGYLCHSDGSGVLRYYSAAGLFKYTPTGNFTTSNLQTALAASGILYHDAYVCIVVGTNNFTCNIDNGSTNLSRMIFIGKEGTTGSISFTSTRTLNSGVDNVTILNGNEGSQVKIHHGTSQDIITIRNL